MPLGHVAPGREPPIASRKAASPSSRCRRAKSSSASVGPGVTGTTTPSGNSRPAGVPALTRAGCPEPQGADERRGHLAVAREAKRQDHVRGHEVAREVLEGQAAGHEQPFAEAGVRGRFPDPRRRVEIAGHHEANARVALPEAGHRSNREVEPLGRRTQARGGHEPKVVRAGPAMRRASSRDGAGSSGEAKCRGRARTGRPGMRRRARPIGLPRERHHRQARFEDALVQGQHRREEIAAEAARHLAAHEGARLPVRPPHLPQVGRDVSALDGLVEHEVVKAPLVQERHPGPRWRAAR